MPDEREGQRIDCRGFKEEGVGNGRRGIGVNGVLIYVGGYQV